jgi:hypothetical protein
LIIAEYDLSSRLAVERPDGCNYFVTILVTCTIRQAGVAMIFKLRRRIGITDAKYEKIR